MSHSTFRPQAVSNVHARHDRSVDIALFAMALGAVEALSYMVSMVFPSHVHLIMTMSGLIAGFAAVVFPFNLNPSDANVRAGLTMILSIVASILYAIAAFNPIPATAEYLDAAVAVIVAVIAMTIALK